MTASPAAPVPLFNTELLDGVPDVAVGNTLEQAHASLTAWGFQALPAVKPYPLDTTDHLHVHAWFHPGGIVVAAQGNPEPDARLISVRGCMLTNLGWRKHSSGEAIFHQSTDWWDADGQAMQEVHCSDSMTVAMMLEILHEPHALAGFEAWTTPLALSCVRLFCIGNDNLNALDKSGQLDGWMSTAPLPLQDYLRFRSRRDQNNLQEDFTHRRGRDRFHHHLRCLAAATGVMRPAPEERDMLLSWLPTSAEGYGGRYGMDYHRLHNGCSQASVTSFFLHHAVAQCSLLQWIKKAPIERLASEVREQDAAGCTLLGLLVRAAVADPELAGGPVVEMMGLLCTRLGAPTVQEALSEQGNLTGMVVGEVRQMYRFPHERQHQCLDKTAGFLRQLQQLGLELHPVAQVPEALRSAEESACVDLLNVDALDAFWTNPWNGSLAPQWQSLLMELRLRQDLECPPQVSGPVRRRL